MNYELKKTVLMTVLGCLVAVHAVGDKKKEVLPYQNAALTVDARVSDLLQRMTLEEKLGQLRCTMSWGYYDLRKEERGKGKVESGKRKVEREVVPSEQFVKDIEEGQIGMLWATYRADPWTQKSLENGLTPELAAKCGNALQRYVREHTRLGIPLFLAEEAPHGHMAIGTTVFPTGLGMAATWSPMLIEQAGRVISKEIRLQGGHISYGPVLDLARDPRWSRVEETMGEDPVLTGIIGAAQVRGLGGGDLSQPYSTLATLKHFIAYGTTEGGQNGGPTLMGPREMWENFLPPFKRAIDAGALSVMTSYNSMDGQPCTSNGYLLTDVLRRQWQFRGFVVSDLFSIDGLAGTHRVAGSRQEAGALALMAGVDVDLGAACFGKLDGDALMPYIDRAVERVLRLKFEMGLFDNPYVDPAAAAREVRSEANRQVALDVARASITLLKNSPLQPPPTGGGSSATILPLPLERAGGRLRLLVCGPNADNVYNMLGDYTAPQDDGNVKTVLAGIRQKGVDVEYVKGCAIRDTTQSTIGEAVEAARRCDVIVCCVGGSSARDFKTSYKETGAAEIQSSSSPTLVSDMDCGEGFDRATLTLLGHQQQLLEALKATGKPLVVVYIEGRPLDKSWAAEHADALLTAYYPGQEGGTAIADVLFGDYNPAGRLPVSVPANIGQLPVYYNKKAPRPHDYVEMSAKPLYAFGHGLSYTTFEYSNLVISRKEEGVSRKEERGRRKEDTPFNVQVDVTNTGERDGEEVVQLYLHDDQASTVQPVMQLKAFERVYIKRGETRTVSFTLTADDLAIVDATMQRVVEPGTFTVLVGAASDDIRLRGQLEVQQEEAVLPTTLGAGCLGLKIPHPGKPLLGTWSGKLDVGPMSLTLVLHLEQADGFMKVTLDSPDQGAKGIPAKKEYVSDDSLAVAVEMNGATFRARLKDGKLDGTFSQNGFTAPLVLTKGEPEVKRPQCPQPPYPYETEEVVFKNEADGATLAGTLTWPEGYERNAKEQPAVVLLVSGSGQQNRDEELFDHKPFLVIADYLARHGIATLRYDDRATGASVGGDVQNATTQDFMRDAAAGLDFLRSKKAFSRVGILGHSEGGSIAFMLGAQGKVDFIVSLAGPGVKGDTLLAAQGNRILSLSGQPANMTVEKYRQQEAVQQMAWMRWFIDYDPSEDIRQTRCPVFALNGDRDCQVIASQNLPAIRQLLQVTNEQTGSRRLVKEYPGLNHLFQHCTTEYGQIEETIAPEVLQDVVEWIGSFTSL